MALVGIVLAAGAGTRAGGPKALVPGWLENAVRALAVCDGVIVVLGAAPDAPVPPGATAVVAEDWAEGLSASLRAGLRTAAETGADAAILTLVDLPGMPAGAVERVAAASAPLARAVYAGAPGHPVLIGREHWTVVIESATGDRGAGPYLRAHGAVLVECGDLWDGADRDF